MSNNDHFSYTQLACWLRCQAQYYYRYIEHLQSPSSLAMIRGNAFHNAAAYGYSHLDSDRKLPKLQELLNIYSDTWDDEVTGKTTDRAGKDKTGPKPIIKKNENPGEIKDTGIKLLTKYYQTIMPEIIPEQIECRKTCDFMGIKLLSYIDIITWTGGVIDIKTVSRKKSEQDIINDLQAPFYAITLKQDRIDFEYHECVDNAKLEVIVVPADKTIDDITFTGNVICKAWKQIQTGIFIPNTLQYLCSPDYCGFYRSICRFPGSF